MWSSRTLGLQNPRSLLRLVWWNNVTHLGMRPFKEQYDCQREYFTVSEEYVEYKVQGLFTRNAKQRTTKVPKEAPGNGRESHYNNKIWKTDGGERDVYSNPL